MIWRRLDYRGAWLIKKLIWFRKIMVHKSHWRGHCIPCLWREHHLSWGGKKKNVLADQKNAAADDRQVEEDSGGGDGDCRLNGERFGCEAERMWRTICSFAKFTPRSNAICMCCITAKFVLCICPFPNDPVTKGADIPPARWPFILEFVPLHPLLSFSISLNFLFFLCVFFVHFSISNLKKMGMAFQCSAEK